METTLTDFQINFLLLLTKIISIIAITALVFVVLLYFLLKQIRSFAYELVVILCIIEILNGITMLIPINSQDNDDGLCIIQSALNTIFPIASIIWTTFIGFTAFISLKYSNHMETFKNLYKGLFLVFSILIPGIFAIM